MSENATSSTFTLSADRVSMDSPLTITINKAKASYTHTLTYTFWGTSQHTTQRIVTQTDAASVTWVPSASFLAPLLTDAEECGEDEEEDTWCKIQMVTYDGNAIVSPERVAYVVLRVPDAAVPVATEDALVIAKVNTNPVVLGWDVWLQGYTSMSATVDHDYITEAYDSSIVSGKVVCDGETDTTTPYTHTVFTNSGYKNATLTVKDQRGRWSEPVQQSFYVLPYYKPYCSNVTVYRSNAEGEPDEDGTLIYAAATPSYALVGGNNSAYLKLYFKEHSGSTWSLGYDVTTAGGIISGPVIAPNTAYDVKIVPTDSLGTGNIYETLISTRTVTWHAKEGGKAFAIGMMASELDDETFECAWDTKLDKDLEVGENLTVTGDVTIGEHPMSDYVIDQYESNNKAWRKWASGISEFWGRTVLNAEPCLTQPWENEPFYITGTINSDLDFPDGLFLTGSGLKLQISWASSAGTPAWVWNDGSQGTLVPCQIKLMRPYPAYLTGRIHYFYQGRWK